MSATARQLEFEIEWLDIDPTKVTAKIVALTPRATTWLDHRGAGAIVARVNAAGRPRSEVGEAFQDLLEEDAGILPSEPGLDLTWHPSRVVGVPLTALVAAVGVQSLHPAQHGQSRASSRQDSIAPRTTVGHLQTRLASGPKLNCSSAPSAHSKSRDASMERSIKPT